MDRVGAADSRGGCGVSGALYALTLWRPWDWAILHAPPEKAKRVENRDWPPPRWLVGKYIALHAGKTWDENGSHFIMERGLFPPHDGPVGAIVGIVRIARVCGPDDVPPEQTQWAFGPWCWLLDEVRAIEPVPCRGHQKLWRVPDDVADEVRRRWKKAA